MRKRIILLLVIQFLMVQLYAGMNNDSELAKKELLQINKAYLQLTNFRLKMEYLAYDNHTAQKPFEKSKGYMIRAGNDYMIDQLGIKTIRNNRCQISIDTVNRIMIISKPRNAELEVAPASMMGNILANCKSVTVTRLDKISECRIVMKPGADEISEAVIQYDKNFFVRKIMLYHSGNSSIQTGPRIEIIYSTPDKTHFAGKEIFSEKKYVNTGKNNRLSPSEKFTGYKLIDQLNQ